MLPKSIRKAYVGFDDGSKSVKYYNAKTRKILTSRNFCFLSIDNKTPPEEIMVTLKIPHEGEMQENMLPMGSDSQKRECEEEGEDNIKMSNKWAKRVDYRYLDDPYADEFDLSFTMSPLGELESQEEAKRSPE